MHLDFLQQKVLAGAYGHICSGVLGVKSLDHSLGRQAVDCGSFQDRGETPLESWYMRRLNQQNSAKQVGLDMA